VHVLRRTNHWLGNHFGRIRWNSFYDVGHVEFRFGPFVHSVSLSVQDRCTVCAKCTIGSKIILHAPIGTPR
jgi:hypothetical protein